MRYDSVIVLLALATISTAAHAADEDICAQDMVCASNPQSVVTALQDAGYRAKLEKDTTGPYIKSAAGGYNFEVIFIGCKESIKCDSMQFNLLFSANDANTPEYANGFNVKYRFLQVAATSNKQLRVALDVTTIGGVTKRNFKDVLDTWSRGLNAFSTYANQQAATITKPPVPVVPLVPVSVSPG